MYHIYRMISKKYNFMECFYDGFDPVIISFSTNDKIVIIRLHIISPSMTAALQKTISNNVLTTAEHSSRLLIFKLQRNSETV